MAQPSVPILHRVHGGAWKVAYADFVTAMMALFMVLWICAQDEEILIGTAKYFQSPFSSPLTETYGVMEDGSPSYQKDEGSARSIVDMAFLHKLAEEFTRLLDIDETKIDKPIEIAVTSDGLRITLYDQSQQPLFKAFSSELTHWGDFTVQNLSWIMDRYNMRVRIDAFTKKIGTDFKLDIPKNYDPLDLTALRANRIQKTLRHYGMNQRIDRVTGFGDEHPLPKIQPDSEKNQRVELSLVAN